jgi:hypothetical protein
VPLLIGRLHIAVDIKEKLPCHILSLHVSIISGKSKQLEYFFYFLDNSWFIWLQVYMDDTTVQQPTSNTSTPTIDYDLTTGPIAVVLTITTLVILYLINHYGDRRTIPWYIGVTIVFGWLFPFYTVILLPLDLSSVSD